MPRKEHIENLYDELLRWSNRYRLYFALVQPELAARAVPLHVKSFLNTCGQHRFGLLKKSQARRQTVPAGDPSDRFQTSVCNTKLAQLKPKDVDPTGGN